MSVHLVMKLVQKAASAAEASEFPVDVDLSATVAELKEQVAEKAGLPKEHIRLVCAGRIWADASTVGSYEPRDGSVVHLVHNAPRGAAPAAAAQVPQATNPMQQLLGGGVPAVPAAAPGDPMQAMMAQSQQMLMQNPEMVQEIMRSPMVQQMMSDPETVRAMMRMNPQLNQLLEQRPEIARLLEDPEVLRQSMQMMANPSLMREMTRNADRAIGQLDAMPGGHSALLRAHQEFADPLYQALSGASGEQITENVTAYAQQTQGAPNTEALPNPWGAPAAAPTAATGPAPARPAAAVTATPPLGALGAGVPAGNPMAAMMQQMMSDPAQMQQMMAATQQLFGGAARAAPPGATGTAEAAVTAPAMNPMAAMMNPAQMQQQMMAMQLLGGMGGAGNVGAGTAPPAFAGMAQHLPGNPAQPQQANPMALLMQQMMGNPAMFGGFGGLGGAPFAGAGVAGTTPVAAAQELTPEALALQRVRFASQLSQLMGMGFTNEGACLRALVRHNGRIDAAIDSLLSGTFD